MAQLPITLATNSVAVVNTKRANNFFKSPSQLLTLPLKYFTTKGISIWLQYEAIVEYIAALYPKMGMNMKHNNRFIKPGTKTNHNTWLVFFSIKRGVLMKVYRGKTTLAKHISVAIFADILKASFLIKIA